MSHRLEQVLTALDQLHSEDPKTTNVADEPLPAELLYAQRMSKWLAHLNQAPSECLQIAVRAQHLQRWQVAREAYPEGRVGYLTWRRDQGIRAGDTAAQLMREAGYSTEDAERVITLITKKGLGRDADVQTLEDCACLDFWKLLCPIFRARSNMTIWCELFKKPGARCHPKAHELALALPMSPASAALVKEALQLHV